LSLEIVVRPVVFPNIRPAPARSLPPVDDPDKGFAVIHGNGGKQIDLTSSWSSSASQNKRQETQRRVDEVRVYQKEDNGTVNKENFVDLDVVNKLWMEGAPKDFVGFNGDDRVATYPGRGFTGDDIVPKSKGGTTKETTISWYRPAKEADNIEIKKKDKILKSHYDI